MKYKKCCEGNVNWEEFAKTDSAEAYLHMTNRGKNLAFLVGVNRILQLDTSRPVQWTDIKRACTPQAVRAIHELIAYIWPSAEDLDRVLKTHRDRHNSLYVGMYEPKLLIQGVCRHALYSDHILLYDPFLDYRRIAPEFNPIEHPERHIFQTLKNLDIWMQFAPWIDAGLVSFIRSPANYDYKLFRAGIEYSEAMLKAYPELSDALDQAPDQSPESRDAINEILLLLMPEDRHERYYREAHPDATEDDAQRFLARIRHRRESHPYIVGNDRDWRSQRHCEHMTASAGESLAVARVTANQCSASLVTDIPFRWKQIELDRQANSSPSSAWEPVAKAFGGVKLEVLNRVPLPAVLTLHQEGMLSSMRVFLNRLFRNSCRDDEFDEGIVQILADELQHEIAVAKEEWRAIDRRLNRWLTMSAIGGLGSGIYLASPHFLGATVLAVAAQYGFAWNDKRNLNKKMPAAFFLDLDAEVYGGRFFGL